MGLMLGQRLGLKLSLSWFTGWIGGLENECKGDWEGKKKRENTIVSRTADNT